MLGPGALLARDTWMKHVRVMSVSNIPLLQLVIRVNSSVY
jgi:hypothetical protein